MSMKTKLANLIKARQGVVAVRTHEGERLMDVLWEICNPSDEELAAGEKAKTLLEWTCSSGIVAMKWAVRAVGDNTIRERAAAPVEQFKGEAKYNQPPGAIQAAMDYKMPNPKDVLVVAVHNFHHYMTNPQIQQLLVDANDAFLRDRRVVVLVGPVFNIPNELSKAVTVVDWPLPTPDEIRQQVEDIAEMARRTGLYEVELDGNTQLVVRALQGMTEDEIAHTLNLIFATFGRLDASQETLKLITERKANIVKATRALEYFDTDEQMGNVGGLEFLKRYIREVAAVYSDEARAFGALPPRGVVLVGPPGTGKSLVSKCIASLFGLPLVRLDAGSLFSSLVGSSEENIRQAFRVVEAVAPCILWIDEGEKGLGGGGGELDGGTSQRVFATILTWVQERARPAGVFVAMTANSVRKIDPALFQRFDQFCVDLPDEQARRDILSIHLGKNGRSEWEKLGVDVNYIASMTEGYSGRELEEAVLSAVRKAFLKRCEEGYEGDITNEILLEAVQEIVPVVRSMVQELAAIREWARTARPAGRPSTYTVEQTPEEVGMLNV